jgi:hypothetical protein
MGKRSDQKIGRERDSPDGKSHICGHRYTTWSSGFLGVLFRAGKWPLNMAKPGIKTCPDEEVISLFAQEGATETALISSALSEL